MSSAYERNMETLKSKFPDFHKWIEGQPDCDWLVPDGDQLYIMAGSVATPMYDDPEEDKKVIDGMPLHKENVSVVIGLGLGDTVAAICKKMEKGHHVVVVEPVGHVYRLAFERHDFSEHIKANTLLFAPGKAEIDMLTALLDSGKSVSDWALTINRVCAVRREYLTLIDYVVEVIGQIQCNTGTVISSGAKIADNDVATLPWVITHRGVGELVGLFAGKPAICVSTGPSLARNIHLLRDAQDKAVIIAVGQALRPLLAYDVRPDFICTVDFGEVNMTHFAGLLDETVPLVTINKTYAPLIKAYRGPKFISATAYGTDTVHSVLADMGELPQGGSVAHMCFGLAAVMGCQPIMFVGQDLALSDASHFGQADSGGKVEVVDGMIHWKIDDPRSTTLHARDDIGMGPAQYVPGWWGGQVLTNTGLQAFITAMRRLVAMCDRPVINCTEGGAHIEGTQRMLLADALAKWCTTVVDKSALPPLLTNSPNAGARIRRACELIEGDIKTLDDIIEHSNKGIDTVNKMRTTTNKDKLNKLFKQNYMHSEAAHAGARRLPPVNTAIFWASRQIEGRELNVVKDIKHVIERRNRKDLLTRLQRNEIILTAAREASKSLRGNYGQTKLVLTAALLNPAMLEPTGETTLADLSDAQHYLDIGNFAKPLLEARRVLAEPDKYSAETRSQAVAVYDEAERIRAEQITAAQFTQESDKSSGRSLKPLYMDLIERSRRHGRDDDNMKAAIKLLREAHELVPGEADALWGLASALLHDDQLDESIKAYEELVAKFPDKQRYRFELGQALILGGRPADGLVKIKEAMSASTEFDHFFGALARLYAESGMPAEARQAAAVHLERHPQDIVVKKMLEELMGSE